MLNVQVQANYGFFIIQQKFASGKTPIADANLPNFESQTITPASIVFGESFLSLTSSALDRLVACPLFFLGIDLHFVKSQN
jgi:hypothetical protein